MELGWPVQFFGNFGPAARVLLTAANVPCVESQDAGTPEDLTALCRQVKKNAVGGVVLDSYAIDSEYLRCVAATGQPVLVIDDFGNLSDYPCSAILNFTMSATELTYHTAGARLLGPQFFLARRPLRQLRKRTSARCGTAEKILVAMGGADALGLTSRVVRALAELHRGAVRVVVGSDSPLLEDPALPQGWEMMVRPPDLGDAFAWADVCVCAGGMTKYEAAFLGVPAAVLAENEGQWTDTLEFARRGLAHELGFAPHVGPALLAERLAEFLGNRGALERLARSGRAAFPDDPTLAAAGEFTQLLRSEAIPPSGPTRS
jgi:spore coat polysaccharide biosynthesis predicted glycosyltransferase SpsG